MSNQEFFGVWKQEAVAALEAVKTGVIKHLWKVPGKYEVFLVMGVDSVDQMDEIMHSLPIWKLGYDYIVSSMEWIPLRSYEHWAKQLDELSAGYPGTHRPASNKRRARDRRLRAILNERKKSRLGSGK